MIVFMIEEGKKIDEIFICKLQALSILGSWSKNNFAIDNYLSLEISICASSLTVQVQFSAGAG